MSTKKRVQAILSAFDVEGDLAGVIPWTLGHIHDTYFTVSPAGNRTFVVQHLNTDVFQNPIGLMENTSRVLAYLRKRWSEPDSAGKAYRVPRLVLTRSGEAVFVDAEGSSWRVFEYLAGTRSIERVSQPAEALEAGRIFGTFLATMEDFPPPGLIAILPGLHSGPRRLEQFQKACRADLLNRAKGARQEIEKVQQREELVRLGPGSNLPIRTVHSDAKITNVLFDVASSRAVALIDLDTVMPGPVAFDFGDLVRTIPVSSLEEGAIGDSISIDLSLFRALSEGYLAGSAGLLTGAERGSLVRGALFITFLVAVRFLTDYLEGDHYFRTESPDQNLRRSRTQLQLLEALENREGDLQKILDDCGA